MEPCEECGLWDCICAGGAISDLELIIAKLEAENEDLQDQLKDWKDRWEQVTAILTKFTGPNA